MYVFTRYCWKDLILECLRYLAYRATPCHLTSTVRDDNRQGSDHQASNVRRTELKFVLQGPPNHRRLASHAPLLVLTCCYSWATGNWQGFPESWSTRLGLLLFHRLVVPALSETRGNYGRRGVYYARRSESTADPARAPRYRCRATNLTFPVEHDNRLRNPLILMSRLRLLLRSGQRRMHVDVVAKHRLELPNPERLVH